MATVYSPTRSKKFTAADLQEVGIVAIERVLRAVSEQMSAQPDVSLRTVTIESSNKKALVVDLQAEDTFATTVRTFKNKRFAEVEIFGEERLGREKIALHDHPGTCVLVDAIDGTDLFERGLGNWCSAAIFFTPSNPVGRRIRTAVVGLPDRSIYFASDEEEGVFVKRPRGETTLVNGPSKNTNLRSASICFYGQKQKNFMAVASLPLWGLLVEPSVDGQNQPPDKARIYDLAGIPMMMKLIDPICAGAASIDAIFDLPGQKPHDVVPGAFLAKKAGATLLNLDGTELTYEHLEEVMLEPNNRRLKYILTSTNELAQQFISALAPVANAHSSAHTIDRPMGR